MSARSESDALASSPGERRKTDGMQARENKRRLWAAKQEEKRAGQQRDEKRDAWFCRNMHYATYVSADHAEALRSSTSERVGGVLALLRPYCDLQDGPKSTGATGARSELFIAEGTETVRLLIRQSLPSSSSNKVGPIQMHSIFTKPSILFDDPVRLLGDVESVIQSPSAHEDANGLTMRSPPFHVLVAEEQTQSSIVGFPVSRGALACGVVPKHHTQDWLMNEHLPNKCKEKNGALRLLALDGISDTANLGSIIRCASAFGVDAVLLSRDSCDAWYRRAVRVSMGHVVRVPCVRVTDLAEVLLQLTKNPTLVQSFAAVIDQESDLVLERLEKGTCLRVYVIAKGVWPLSYLDFVGQPFCFVLAAGGVTKSWCCVLGNEANGISSSVVKACTHTIRIDMDPDVDSLSVPIAAGILLHGLKEREEMS